MVSRTWKPGIPIERSVPGHRLSGVRIYSHLERQLISYQVNAVLGEYGFSHLEARNTNRTFSTGDADS